MKLSVRISDLDWSRLISERAKIRAILRDTLEHLPREERKAKLLAHKKNPDAVKIFSDDGEQVPESAIESELKELTESADTLQSQINEFDQNPNKKVRE